MAFAIIATPLTSSGEQDALLADPTADISQETLKDIDFCKKLKSAILTAWTKARSAIKTEVQYQDLFCVAELNHIKTQIAQSLGDDPNSELNEGVPNRRPSSVDILQLSAKILQSVPGAKNVKPSVALAVRTAFLARYFAVPLLAYITNPL